MIWACSVLTSPALPNDLAKIESCIQYAVEQGTTDVINIATTCDEQEEQFVADFITALLNSSWAAAHPTLVGPLKSGLVSFRSKVSKP